LRKPVNRILKALMKVTAVIVVCLAAIAFFWVLFLGES